MAVCPHCAESYDASQRLSGDVVYCPNCGKWSTVRHNAGGTTTLTKRDEPPTSWPRRSGTIRRP